MRESITVQTNISKVMLILGWCLLLTGIITAQESETFTGEIVGDRDTDEMTITLNEGDNVIITATAAAGSNIDTVLYLEDPDGDEVAENDDYNYPTTTDSQIAYTAASSGEHTIIIDNFPGSPGEYVVTVEYVTPEQVAAISGDFTSLIGEPDEVYTGELEDDDDTDQYSITLAAGEGVVIDLIAEDSYVMDPFLSLIDQTGEEVAVNDDRVPGEVFDSQIVYIAEEGGTFGIVVDNFPGYFGAYELRITFVDNATAAELLAITNAIPETSTTPDREPDLIFEGSIIEDDEFIDYTIDVQAGQGVIAAVFETDGRMDTTLSVFDPAGVEFVFNDDRGDYSTFDSQVAFTAQETGTYTIRVDNYPGSPGDFRLEIYFASDEETALALQALREILSGDVEQYETVHFIIHYTTEGVDAAEVDYIELVGETMEEVLDIQVNQLGWALPPSDAGQGGDDRFDVYIRNLDSVFGYMTSSSPAGDNPNTDAVETEARAGYMVLDNDYIGYGTDPIGAMRATAAHEFHHIIQYGYDSSDYQWYFESTASWMETVTFPDEEEATIYVEDVFTFPEICFGGQGRADVNGFGVYGTWLFLEFMTAELDADAPRLLWENIASGEEWEPLEATLAAYDETLLEFVPRYHVNNLVRDYLFVDSFDDLTVWVEDRIDEMGEWEPQGEGIQELAANFYEFDLSDFEEGRYEFIVDDLGTDIEVYFIGITDDEGEVFALGESGTVDITGYDDAYVMLFSPDYDDDMNACRYETYTLTVQESFREAASVAFTVDASNFEAPDIR